jgi:DNA-binding CsgD family transcriptional regulator/tetratricopeptide (TPR) repeat protein
VTGSVVSPVLVGRAAETAILRAAYERARSGRPGTVLISGEAGIGKSRLVTTVARSLPGDPLVLSGGCLELGAEGAPYVPFIAVLRDLVRRLGLDTVAALLPPAGSALGDWLPDLGPAPARYPRTRLLEEMLTLVSRVSEAQPVVVVVEDLHWADASSRELFAYLARNLSTAAVLLVGTFRTGELPAGHPNRRVLAELGRSMEVTHLALDPLAPGDVAELLAAVDGRPADPARARRIHRRSGGNPLFVEALSGTGEAPAGDLRSLLLDRITALPEAARQVLSTLAVAGAEVAGEVLGEVSGMPPESVRSAVNDLAERDLVVAGEDGYAIRHDLIREVVYSSLPPAERRQAHAGYAAALSDRADQLTGYTALAEHWTAAGKVERALPAAWHAAARAGRSNAYDEQLYLLELILARWTEVADPVELIGAGRATVLEEAAAAAFAAGRSAASIAHSTAAMDGVDPAVEPQRVAQLLGLRGRSQNRVDGGGWDDLRRAIALLPADSGNRADPLRSRLLSALAAACIGAHRHDEGRRYATEALRLADQLDDDSLRAPALLVIAASDGIAGQLERARRAFAEARRLAEAVGDEHTFLITFQWEAGHLEAAGRYEEAIELADAGQRAARRLGQTRSRGSMLALARATPLRMLGRWDEALRIVDDALADSPPPLYAAFLRLVAADIARCRGETERFEALMRPLILFAQHAQGAAEAVAEIAVQHIALTADHSDRNGRAGRSGLDAADRLLGEQLDRLEGTATAAEPAPEVLRLLLLGARIQQARRAAAPRNRQVADATAVRLAQLTSMVDAVPPATPASAAYRLTLDAIAAADDLSTWDRAATAWRDLGNPYETAMVLTEAASAALASNNRPGARSRLREARALATDLGAVPLLARIDDLTTRGRLTDRPDTATSNEFGLTHRELDVLRVLARGRSNPQIATELFITPNTVATHVARILTKLGVATRTEAVARAHETGLIDT